MMMDLQSVSRQKVPHRASATEWYRVGPSVITYPQKKRRRLTKKHVNSRGSNLSHSKTELPGAPWFRVMEKRTEPAVGAPQGGGWVPGISVSLVHHPQQRQGWSGLGAWSGLGVWAGSAGRKCRQTGRSEWAGERSGLGGPGRKYRQKGRSELWETHPFSQWAEANQQWPVWKPPRESEDTTEEKTGKSSPDRWDQSEMEDPVLEDLGRYVSRKYNIVI